MFDPACLHSAVAAEVILSASQFDHAGLHLTALGKIVPAAIDLLPAGNHTAVLVQIIRVVLVCEPAFDLLAVRSVVIPFALDFFPLAAFGSVGACAARGSAVAKLDGSSLSVAGETPCDVIVVTCVRVNDGCAGAVASYADRCVVIDAVAVPVVVNGVAAKDIAVCSGHEFAVFLEIRDSSGAVDPCVGSREPLAVLGHAARVQALGYKVAAVHAGVLSVSRISGSCPFVRIGDRLVGGIGISAVSVCLEGRSSDRACLEVVCCSGVCCCACCCVCRCQVCCGLVCCDICCGQFCCCLACSVSKEHLVFAFIILFLLLNILEPGEVSVCIGDGSDFPVSGAVLGKHCCEIIAIGRYVLSILVCAFCIAFGHPLVDVDQDLSVLFAAGSYSVTGDQACQLLCGGHAHSGVTVLSCPLCAYAAVCLSGLAVKQVRSLSFFIISKRIHDLCCLHVAELFSNCCAVGFHLAGDLKDLLVRDRCTSRIEICDGIFICDAVLVLCSKKAAILPDCSFDLVAFSIKGCSGRKYGCAECTCRDCEC